MLDTTLDPFADEVRRRPLPHLAMLRSQAPVYKVPGRPLYLVTRYDDCVEVSLNSKSFVNRPEGFESALAAIGFTSEDDEVLSVFASSSCPSANVLRTADNPDHARTRRAVAAKFNSHRIDSMFRQTIERRCTDLLDALPAGSVTEFMGRFAVPLPVGVIAEVLGVREDRQPEFKHWSDEWIASVGKQLTSQQWLVKASAKVALDDFFLDEVNQRIAEPADDLLGELVKCLSDPEASGRLSVPEIVTVAEQMLVGGNETTTQLLGRLVLLLAQHPDQYAALREDRTLVTNAIEEALRITSPLVGLYKNCAVDTTVGGTLIEAGSVVAIMWGSANRDSSRFENPDSFNIMRPNAKKHIAFGIGPHLCIGAPLSRLEATIALQQILDRFSEIRVGNDFTPDRGDSFLMEDMRELSVAFVR
jgi:cytochrome P450